MGSLPNKEGTNPCANPYSMTKLTTEIMCIYLRQCFGRIAIMRIFQKYFSMRGKIRPCSSF